MTRWTRSVVATVRMRLACWWIAFRAPWPIVWECHSDHRPEHICRQCDGSHAHMWVEWCFSRRNNYGLPVQQGRAVRCCECGARKCDLAECLSRRHHRDAHIFPDGLERVGGAA